MPGSVVAVVVVVFGWFDVRGFWECLLLFWLLSVVILYVHVVRQGSGRIT